MQDISEDFHLLEFLDRKGNLGRTSGLNWGQGSKAHTNRDDAYIPIRRNDILRRKELFEPKAGGSGQVVTLYWDDGTVMSARFEGTQLLGGYRYPKQISSFSAKAELGRYLRLRLGVALGARVDINDLDRYGRTSVGIRRIGEAAFLMDFSV